MKLIFTCCFFLLVSTFSYAAYSNNNQDSGYSFDGNQNKNSSDTSSKDSSTTKTDRGNNELVKKMDQSTEKSLKVFDKVLGKDGDQAKQDFAQNIGQNPTSGELGGGDEVKNPFSEVFGVESKNIDQGGR